MVLMLLCIHLLARMLPPRELLRQRATSLTRVYVGAMAIPSVINLCTCRK